MLVASLCFQEMPLFLAITASALFTSVLVHSIRSEAVPLYADSLDISSQGKDSAVRREGHHGSRQETGLCPWLCPSWRAHWARHVLCARGARHAGRCSQSDYSVMNTSGVTKI